MRAGLDPRQSRPATGGPSRRGSRSLALALVLAATASTALTACGSDDDTETTVAPDASAAAPAATTAPATPAGPQGTEQERAAAVVTAYIAAFSAGDGGAVCKLYTEAERKRIAKAAKDTCEEGIRTAYAQGGGDEGFQQSLGNLRAGDTRITGRKAVVKLVALQGGQGGGDAAALEFELERSGKTWKIARPGGGR